MILICNYCRSIETYDVKLLKTVVVHNHNKMFYQMNKLTSENIKQLCKLVNDNVLNACYTTTELSEDAENQLDSIASKANVEYVYLQYSGLIIVKKNSKLPDDLTGDVMATHEKNNRITVMTELKNQKPIKHLGKLPKSWLYVFHDSSKPSIREFKGEDIVNIDISKCYVTEYFEDSKAVFRTYITHVTSSTFTTRTAKLIQYNLSLNLEKSII